MADGEQTYGWQTFPWDEPLHPHANSFEFNAVANDSDTNVEIGEGLEAYLRQVDQSADQGNLHETARQNVPRYKHPSLPRRRSRYLLSQPSNQTRPADQPWLDQSSLPIFRWRDSPPQHEAASLSAIYGALQNQSLAVPKAGHNPRGIETFNIYRGPASAASSDSRASGSSLPSSTSGCSASSNASHHVLVKKQRQKIRAPKKEKKRNSHAQDRRFKCTFCCDTFRHKFDWARHENALHLNLEEWRCTPHGAVVIRSQTGRVHCAYCDMLDPKPDHLDLHNHHACHNDQNAQHFFRRKDHLVQHLRHLHKLDSMPMMDDWKVDTGVVSSRCGFCDIRLDSWEERAEHLAIHFRSGKTMLDWKGDHEFEPAVASRVKNSLPPYLIGAESLAPVPFSATNPASIDHFKQISLEISNNAQESLSHSGRNEEAEYNTDPDNHIIPGSCNKVLSPAQELESVAFADILTRHLSQFARLQIAAGVVPTDEMFQHESRRVLYGDGDDTWNTTVADNADWLRSFREQNAYGKSSEAQAHDHDVSGPPIISRD